MIFGASIIAAALASTAFETKNGLPPSADVVGSLINDSTFARKPAWYREGGWLRDRRGLIAQLGHTEWRCYHSWDKLTPVSDGKVGVYGPSGITLLSITSGEQLARFRATKETGGLIHVDFRNGHCLAVTSKGVALLEPPSQALWLYTLPSNDSGAETMSACFFHEANLVMLLISKGGLNNTKELVAVDYARGKITKTIPCNIRMRSIRSFATSAILIGELPVTGGDTKAEGVGPKTQDYELWDLRREFASLRGFKDMRILEVDDTSGDCLLVDREGKVTVYDRGGALKHQLKETLKFQYIRTIAYLHGRLWVHDSTEQWIGSVNVEEGGRLVRRPLPPEIQKMVVRVRGIRAVDKRPLMICSFNYGVYAFDLDSLKPLAGCEQVRDTVTDVSFGKSGEIRVGYDSLLIRRFDARRRLEAAPVIANRPADETIILGFHEEHTRLLTDDGAFLAYVHPSYGNRVVVEDLRGGQNRHATYELRVPEVSNGGFACVAYVGNRWIVAYPPFPGRSGTERPAVVFDTSSWERVDAIKLELLGSGSFSLRSASECIAGVSYLPNGEDRPSNRHLFIHDLHRNVRVASVELDPRRVGCRTALIDHGRGALVVDSFPQDGSQVLTVWKPFGALVRFNIPKRYHGTVTASPSVNRSGTMCLLALAQPELPGRASEHFVLAVELATGRVRDVLPFPSSRVSTVAFDPSASHKAAIGCWNGVVTYWDLSERQRYGVEVDDPDSTSLAGVLTNNDAVVAWKGLCAASAGDAPSVLTLIDKVSPVRGEYSYDSIRDCVKSGDEKLIAKLREYLKTEGGPTVAHLRRSSVVHSDRVVQDFCDTLPLATVPTIRQITAARSIEFVTSRESPAMMAWLTKLSKPDIVDAYAAEIESQRAYALVR